MTSALAQLFEQIYGTVPTSGGIVAERLAAAVCTLLSGEEPLLNDRQLRGTLSTALQQAAESEESGVGQPGGYVPAGNPARMVHLGPRIERDAEGHISRIVVEMTILASDYQQARFEPEFTEEGYAKALALTEQGLLNTGENQVRIDTIYDVHGKKYCTIHQLTSLGYEPSSDNHAEGAFELPDCAIQCGEALLPIVRIYYWIPLLRSAREIHIGADGKVALLAKDEAQNIDTLVCEKDLRRVKFDEAGQANL